MRPPVFSPPGARPLHLPVDLLVDLVGEELHVLLLLAREKEEHLPDRLLLRRLRVFRVVPDRRVLAIQRHPHHVQRVDRHSIPPSCWLRPRRAPHCASAWSLAIRPMWILSSASISSRSSRVFRSPTTPAAFP